MHYPIVCDLQNGKINIKSLCPLVMIRQMDRIMQAWGMASLIVLYTGLESVGGPTKPSTVAGMC